MFSCSPVVIPRREPICRQRGRTRDDLGKQDEKSGLMGMFCHRLSGCSFSSRITGDLLDVLVPFPHHPRDELFRQSLAKLREQLVKANTLVREANFLAEEMSKLTDYQVTLQIPAANLSANRKVRESLVKMSPRGASVVA